MWPSTHATTRTHAHAHTHAHTPSRLHTSAQASKLNLVDLAGSERQEPSDADGNGSLNPDGTGSAVDASPRPRGAVDPSLALRESININSGLLALLNVRSPFLPPPAGGDAASPGADVGRGRARGCGGVRIPGANAAGEPSPYAYATRIHACTHAHMQAACIHVHLGLRAYVPPTGRHAGMYMVYRFASSPAHTRAYR